MLNTVFPGTVSYINEKYIHYTYVHSEHAVHIIMSMILNWNEWHDIEPWTLVLQRFPRSQEVQVFPKALHDLNVFNKTN